MMKIKLCGITNPDDALDAINAGADYLGLIFVRGTARCLTIRQALAIKEAVQTRVPLVGVFRDATAEDVEETMLTCGLSIAQLHGNEDLNAFDGFAFPIIKTLHTTPDLNFEVPRALPGMPTHWLLEIPKATADENLNDLPALFEKTTVFQKPWFLAGGLTADNITSVLEQLPANNHPFAVDVSGGIERFLGKKEEEKMRRFCDAVRTFSSRSQSNAQDNNA